MFRAYYAEQMRAVDKAATEIGFVPGIVLMENAAIACVNELKKDFELRGKSVAVFCGKGNNGGDGLAIARHLHNMGVDTRIFLVCGSSYSGDARINFDIVSGMDIPIEALTDTDGLDTIIRSFDVVIDAIFGTGISGNVHGTAYGVIKAINENAKYVLSADVPSGINSDSGKICGICIKADKTVTFAGYKTGMLMYPAADFTGEIVVDMISMPDSAIASQDVRVNVTDAEFIRSIIKPRNANSHKGDYGKLLIIAGSKGMSGAAYMSAQAALKSGAGLITLASCESVNAVLEAKTTEVMTYALPDKDGHISAAAADSIGELLEKADAVLIGPGIGRSDDARELVKFVLHNSSVPVIVDADAINAVAEDKEMLNACACELVFTPHSMEMSRLTGQTVSYVEDNRLELSREFCEEAGAVLLLKGPHTVVTAPSLKQYINITGNPGLATGGSGDVLAGIIAAFTARGIDCDAAAAAAAYIHGMAGDIAKAKLGVESMSATDVLDALPRAFCRILQLDK